jgi:hypothetical protein
MAEMKLMKEKQKENKRCNHGTACGISEDQKEQYSAQPRDKPGPSQWQKN